MIDQFWTWWTDSRPRITEAVSNGHAVADEITERAHLIDLRLEAEVLPGLESRHALCLSSAGDMGIRLLTEQWLQAAPPADAAWEYHAARIPHQLAAIELAGVGIDGASISVSPQVDRDHEQVDVEVWHPAFSGLDVAHQWQAAFAFLDAALGEDGVEAWLGSVVITEDLTGLPMSVLAQEVETLAAEASGERWVLRESADEEGRPVVKTLNTAAKRLDHLRKDTHLEATISLVQTSPEGLPDPDELEYLTILESDLDGSLDGRGVCVARVTHDNRRVLHYYVDVDEMLTWELERWCDRHGSHEARFNLWTDPTWSDREDLLDD